MESWLLWNTHLSQFVTFGKATSSIEKCMWPFYPGQHLNWPWHYNYVCSNCHIISCLFHWSKIVALDWKVEIGANRRMGKCFCSHKNNCIMVFKCDSACISFVVPQRHQLDSLIHTLPEFLSRGQYLQSPIPSSLSWSLVYTQFCASHTEICSSWLFCSHLVSPVILP